VRALATIAPPEAEEPVTRLLDDPEERIRLEALAGLARMEADVVLERAPDFLAAESYWTRSLAVDALGAMGSEGAIPLLVPFLQDDHAWVRRETVIALLRIGSPLARTALASRLDDEDFEVSLYAAESLKRLPEG
jgi:HEAT repeat protein